MAGGPVGEGDGVSGSLEAGEVYERVGDLVALVGFAGGRAREEVWGASDRQIGGVNLEGLKSRVGVEVDCCADAETWVEDAWEERLALFGDDRCLQTDGSVAQFPLW